MGLRLSVTLLVLLLSSSRWGCSSTPETVESQSESEVHPGLFSPSLMKQEAPEKFSIRFETTKGDYSCQTGSKSQCLRAFASEFGACHRAVRFSQAPPFGHLLQAWFWSLVLLSGWC